MITSPLPWNLDIKPSGLVAIKDSSGTEIAQFNDYRDADFLLNFCPDKYRELEKEKESLENRCDNFEFCCGNYKNTIEQLEEQIKLLKDRR